MAGAGAGAGVDWAVFLERKRTSLLPLLPPRRPRGLQVQLRLKTETGC